MQRAGLAPVDGDDGSESVGSALHGIPTMDLVEARGSGPFPEAHYAGQSADIFEQATNAGVRPSDARRFTK